MSKLAALAVTLMALVAFAAPVAYDAAPSAGGGRIVGTVVTPDGGGRIVG